MSELEEFRRYFINTIKNDSALNGTSINEEFIATVSELLCNAEEIPESINYCYYEGVGTSRKEILLHGYTYNDFDESLNLYVIPNSDYSEETSSLTLNDISRVFSKCSMFINDAEFIKENAEESHPAYGIAFDICEKKYSDLKKYQICIVTDKQITKNYKAKNSDTIQGIPVEYQIIDIDRICTLENSLNGKVALEIDLTEFNPGGIPSMLANRTNDYSSYLCNIPGIALAELYNSYGSRLLEGNVRSFLQQKNKVNKGIRATILKEPDNFFVYNNGITATADEVQLNPTRTAITFVKGLQIVNGGQTTASLAACLLNDKKEGSVEKIARISVPMKLTVIPYDKALDLIPNISRYANSQNKVSEADLWSNHPFHIKMEEISRRLVTPIIPGRTHGTYWYYERARGQYKQSMYKKTEAERKKFESINPKAQLLTKTEFAKYLNIRELHPEYACLGGEKSFFKIATQIKDSWDKNPATFNESFFQEIVAIAIIYNDVDKTVKRQGRNYKAQIDAYVVSLFLYLIKKQFNAYINYKDMWNKQDVRIEIHNQLLELIEYVYEELTSESRAVENVTEWAKREKCWLVIKDCPIVLNEEIKDLLLSLQELSDIQGNAKKEEKELTAAQAMVKVYNYGSQSWKNLLEWNKDNHVLTSKEVSIVTIATKMDLGQYPSEKQCLLILKALDRARENGFLK